MKALFLCGVFDDSHNDEIMSLFTGKTLMITGGTGSFEMRF